MASAAKGLKAGAVVALEERAALEARVADLETAAKESERVLRMVLRDLESTGGFSREALCIPIRRLLGESR